MSYIYHLKPENMKGDKLIPLNMMDQDSDLYKKYSKKYIGREELIQQSFPILNCLWNDVVQFSALDPRIIVKELLNYHEDLVLSRKSFYRFKVEDITSYYEAIVFDRDTNRKDRSFKVEEHEVQKLSTETYKELSKVPLRTTQYWAKVKEEGGVFLMFPFITHIMVKGEVDTKLAEEISF